MVVRAHADLRVVPNDLPDDTEESIVGTNWHLEAREVLVAGLASVAQRRRLSWGLYGEVALTGLLHRNGTPYTPRPDLFVLAAPLPDNTAEVALTEMGAPLLVVEIASPSTVGNDLGDKVAAYEGAGVDEYLVLDPTSEMLSESVRGWRRGAGSGFESWSAAQPGEWDSKVLDVTFVVDGPFLRVRDHDGQVMELPRRAPALLIAAEERARQAEEQARQAEEQTRQIEQELRLLRARLQELESAQPERHPNEADDAPAR